MIWTTRHVDPEFAELLDPKAGVPPGVFWADYIKTLKDDPERRLAVARAYLPLPAAFRHAAVALRALIRRRQSDKRKCDLSRSGRNSSKKAADAAVKWLAPYCANQLVSHAGASVCPPPSRSHRS